ncbi:MAG: SLC13 family permease [Mycobacterium sp.]
MEVHLLAIGVLALSFVLGAFRGINLGAVALAAGGALVLVMSGLGIDQLYEAFPAELFVLLVGVTFLFGIATVNGTIEWVVDVLSRAVGGRTTLIPWVLFFVAAVVTSLGALAPVVVGLVAPIAMRMASKHHINPRLVGLMVLHGASAGNFSPINLLGATVNTTLERAGLVSNPLALFVANLGYNAVLGVIIYLVFGGTKLRGKAQTTPGLTAPGGSPATVATGAHTTTDGSGGSGGAGGSGVATSVAPATKAVSDELPSPPERFDIVKGVTLAAILAVGAIAMIGKADLGVLAMAAAVVLSFIMPKSSSAASKKIAWDVVLLITGVVTYIGILTEIGTVKFIGDAANNIASPLFTAIVICFIGAVISAFASSAGIIAVLIPLALPFLLSGDIPVVGMAIAIAISATVVDSTPFSTISAITLSNAAPEDRAFVFRGFLMWGALMVVTAPFVTMIFVVPGMG